MAEGGSLETQLLAAIDAQGQLADSGEFAAGANVDHLVVVGLLKSLQAADMITTEVWGQAGRGCVHTRRRRLLPPGGRQRRLAHQALAPSNRRTSTTSATS